MFTNMATNPSFETVEFNFGDEDGSNTSTTIVGVSSASTIKLSPTIDTTGDRILTAVVTAASSTDTSIGLTATEVPSGSEHTLLVEARSSRALAVQLQIRGATSTPHTLGTEWAVLRTTVPAGSGDAATLTGILIPASSHAAAGDRIEVRSVGLVGGAYHGPHFDGSIPAARWSGEPHRSTSAIAETALTVSGHELWTSGDTEPHEDYRPVRNVRKYGAIGDGVTDDTEALRSALDVGDSTAVVYLPPGNYRITSQILWDPYRAQLQGQDAAIFCDIDDPTVYAVRVCSSARFPGGSPARNTLVTNGGVEFYTTGQRCNGLLFKGEVGDTNEAGGAYEQGRRKNGHLTLSNMLLRGFNIAHSVEDYTYMAGFRDSVFRGNNTALYMPKTGIDRGERIYFENCSFVNNNRFDWMIHMESAETFLFVNCSFDWMAMFLRADDGAKVQLVGCHIESPTDPRPAAGQYDPSPMLRSDEIALAIDGDPFNNRCFMNVTGTATVNITNSLITLNYHENDQTVNPLPFVFHISPWASVNIHQTYIKIPSVAALSAGDGRLSITQPKFWTQDEFIPMLGLNAKHNRLRDGEFKRATVADAWGYLNGGIGAATVVASPAINATAMRMVHGSAVTSELRVTIPVSLPLRVAGVFVKLRADAARPAPSISSVRMDFLDRTGNVLGSMYDEFDRVPFNLSATEWTSYQLVRDVDHESWWNTDLVTNVRVAFVRNDGVNGETFYVGEAFVNFFG